MRYMHRTASIDCTIDRIPCWVYMRFINTQTVLAIMNSGGAGAVYMNVFQTILSECALAERQNER